MEPITHEESECRALRALIVQFDAAIRRIAAELTTKVCCGVDTSEEINPETEIPYGPGGHTGWLLAQEAKKLRLFHQEHLLNTGIAGGQHIQRGSDGRIW